MGAGILLAFIGIKIAGLYKKCCLDMITILVTFISMEIIIYFGVCIMTVLPINALDRGATTWFKITSEESSGGFYLWTWKIYQLPNYF